MCQNLLLVKTCRLAGLVIGIYQSHQFAITFHYQNLGYQRQVHIHILNLLGIDVLARRTQDHILAAALDIDVTLLVDSTQVTGMEPALGVDDIACGIGVLVVTQHHVVALDQQLTHISGSIAEYLNGATGNSYTA